MSDSKTPSPVSPVYVPRKQSPFSLGGLIDLAILLALATASALVAIHYISAKEVEKIDYPTGPLTHIDDPASAIAAPSAAPSPGDQPVQVQSTK